MSDGNRNVLPVELICIAVLTVHFTTSALITTAVNRKPIEYWIKAAPIFVISSDSNKLQNLPARLIQELKINWNHCLRKTKLKLILDSRLQYWVLRSLRGSVTTEAIS